MVATTGIWESYKHDLCSEAIEALAHKENNGSCDGPLWQLAPAPGSPGECGCRWRWQNPQVYKVQVQIQSPSELSAASNSLASQLTSIAGNNIARHDIFTRARCAPPMGPGARSTLLARAVLGTRHRIAFLWVIYLSWQGLKRIT